MVTGSAALLIDIESFYLGREERWQDEHRGEPFDFAEDVELLVRFAQDMAHGRRMAVRRAYADFNSARRREGDERWDFFLRGRARQLMEQGIEPVQLFRYPGGSRRSAADVRLAMDATAMLSGRAGIDLFVLVTGDADLIPLMLELKYQGARVAVIGVSRRTRPVFQRYCDEFEYFEDLVAAADSEEGTGDLDPVRDALIALLERRRPLHFAAVKPLLSRELGRPFDPSEFECDTTGEFLERYHGDLGVAVRRGEHDWLVDLGDGEAPSATARERSARHTPYEYRWLLRMRNPRVHLVPRDDWLRITELFFERAGGSSEVRPEALQAALSEEVVERCARAGIDAADKKVQATAFQLFKSGAFVCAEPGSEGEVDFHWSKPARLADDVRTVDDLRRRALHYVARLLLQRMRSEFGSYDIDSEVLTELLEGPDPDEERIQAIEAVLDAALEELGGKRA